MHTTLSFGCLALWEAEPAWTGPVHARRRTLEALQTLEIEGEAVACLEDGSRQTVQRFHWWKDGPRERWLEPIHRTGDACGRSLERLSSSQGSRQVAITPKEIRSIPGRRAEDMARGPIQVGDPGYLRMHCQWLPAHPQAVSMNSFKHWLLMDPWPMLSLEELVRECRRVEVATPPGRTDVQLMLEHPRHGKMVATLDPLAGYWIRRMDHYSGDALRSSVEVQEFCRGKSGAACAATLPGDRVWPPQAGRASHQAPRERTGRSRPSTTRVCGRGEGGRNGTPSGAQPGGRRPAGAHVPQPGGACGAGRGATTGESISPACRGASAGLGAGPEWRVGGGAGAPDRPPSAACSQRQVNG